MKELTELQSLFFNSIIGNSHEFSPEVKLQGEMTPEERVNIYIDGYRLRLIEALQDAYPAMHTLMGDDDFEQLCLDYINHFPSKHFSIRYFGHQLSDFLTDNHQYGNAALLSEMAVFEWRLRDAFDAKDQIPLSLTDLSQLTPDQWSTLTFKLHPSLCLIDLTWNVPALWQAIEQDAAAHLPQQSQSPVSWLIWRPELETHFRSILKGEANGFKAIQAGKNFSELCELIDEAASNTGEPELAAQEAASYLARWIDEGLLASFECD